MKCKNCNTKLNSKSLFCNSCGEKIIFKKSESHVGIEFLSITIFNLAVLSFATLGLFNIYWFYRNWKAIKEFEGDNIYPFWSAVFAVFTCNALLKKILYYAKKNNYKESYKPGILTAVFIICTLIGNAWGKIDPLPMEYEFLVLILSSLAVIPLLVAQNAINFINESQKQTSNLKIQTGGVILSVVGFILFLVVLFTILYPDTTVSDFKNNKDVTETTQLSNLGNEPEPQTPKASSLCVTEHDVKICELGYNQDPADYSYRLNIGGNTTTCIDAVTSNYLETKSGYANKLKNPQFCVSDWGNIELNKTLQVKKYWGQIVRDYNVERVYVPREYRACIWTYAAGTARSPQIEVLSGSVGPIREYTETDLKAFCLSGTNKVDLYSYESN